MNPVGQPRPDYRPGRLLLFLTLSRFPPGLWRGRSPETDTELLRGTWRSEPDQNPSNSCWCFSLDSFLPAVRRCVNEMNEKCRISKDVEDRKGRVRGDRLKKAVMFSDNHWWSLEVWPADEWFHCPPIRSHLAVHQPRGSDLYRMLGDPQGDGGALLQDPESGPGCPRNLRAAGESTSLSPGKVKEIRASRQVGGKHSLFLSYCCI